MKTLLVSVATLWLATTAWTQGTVNFNNNVAFTTTAERRVFRCCSGYLDPSSALVGTDWVAQLYYGTQGTAWPSLTAVRSFPSRFRVLGTSQPGTWRGGARTLEGILPGQTATLLVRVWNASLFPTYDAAVVNGWGAQSAPFDYTVPLSGSPPPAFYMENFRSFHLAPEPTELVLGGLGALVIWFVRRGRRIALKFDGRNSKPRPSADKRRS